MPEGTINFLAPKELTGVISRVEQNFPGWWYSIYQHSHNVEIHLAPTPNCMLDTDRAWAETKEGDATKKIVVSYVAEGFYENIKEEIANFCEKVKAVRRGFEEGNRPMPPYAGRHRRQEKSDLEHLQKTYRTFLSNVPIYQQLGYCFREFHVGSCQLTVDCTLRGETQKGAPFEYLVDIKEGIIADSLVEVMEDLRETLAEQAG